MNLILLSELDFSEKSNVAVLAGRRLKHIIEIHRAKKGDVLNVGIEGGKIGKGKIVSISKKFLKMEVYCAEKPPKPLDVSLILALPRPIVFNRIISSITSIGVKNIHIINTWRVEKSYWNSPVLDYTKVKEQIILGLEQAKDTILPNIVFHKLFKPFVKNELPNIIKNRDCFIAHPEGISYCKKLSTPSVLAIGPEGGFIDREIDAFTELGFCCASFGQRILRVETAVPFILSKFC